MRHFRLVTALIALTFIIVFGIAVSYIARGYRFDSKNLGFKPTGLFVATSDPTGAQVWLNGQLESATNTTLSLPPDTYDVEIKKQGFLPWKKRLTIKKEEVTKVDTALFPAAPSLSGLTSSGALKPTLSPDGTKVVFGIPLTDKSADQKVGLWVMDLGNLPIGFSTDPKQITSLNPENASWSWSPDSRKILINTTNGSFVIGANGITRESDMVNIKGAKLDKTLVDWKQEDKDLHANELDNLPREIKDAIERKVSSFAFSPDKNKVLYTAIGATNLPDNLIPSLPGSSTQQQDRTIKPGKIYSYDIKEDHNFLLLGEAKDVDLASWKVPEATPSAQKVLLVKISWFPTSNHLVLAEKDKITVMDYDGTNRQIVFAGPYEAPYAIPYPNGNRLLLLTRLGAGSANFPNLYALSLK